MPLIILEMDSFVYGNDYSVSKLMRQWLIDGLHGGLVISCLTSRTHRLLTWLQPLCVEFFIHTCRSGGLNLKITHWDESTECQSNSGVFIGIRPVHAGVSSSPCLHMTLKGNHLPQRMEAFDGMLMADDHSCMQQRTISNEEVQYEHYRIASRKKLQMKDATQLHNSKSL